MTQNRRIFLNIVATYGRSVFALVCGLFTARWVLQALGESDFGLYGVVGALTVFITFLNSMLSGAIGRYYAYSIGEAQKLAASGREDEGLENCRRWFNTALLIHTLIPVALIAVGYPLGIWIVRNYLVVPPERLETCVWVFRLACLSSFVGMVNVPFSAMYTAKQYIAELTVYSFVQTAFNTVFFFYMSCRPGDWLLRYAGWMCASLSIPQIVIVVRACLVFPECRFNRAYLWDLRRIKDLGAYAGWQIFGGLGAMLRQQGIAIVVNRYFGPSMNASMSIANQVNSQTSTLSGAMIGAFTPAITTAYGAGDMETARRMSFRTCRFGLVLMLLFMVPLFIEIEEVMRLWLGTPPECSTGLCLCMMVMLLIDKATVGHMVAVQATGRIAAYQMVLGGALIMTFPLAWLFVWMGWGVYSVCWAMISMTVFTSLGRVLFARRLVGLDMRKWLLGVILPVCAVAGLAAFAACIPRYFMSQSFLRVVCTTIVTEVVLLPLCWGVVLSPEEREFVLRRFRR